MTAGDADAALAAVFASDGPLGRAIPDYRPREQQREMAARVARAMRERHVLLAEAGTGTGKTVAYLVPALLFGGKAIVSTGTKTLQDQLFHRDLPAVREALGLPVTVALLKGRANYVCPHHLERNLEDGRFATRETAGDLQRIARFAAQTRSGDKAELADVPEESPAWPLAMDPSQRQTGAMRAAAVRPAIMGRVGHRRCGVGGPRARGRAPPGRARGRGDRRLRGGREAGGVVA